MHGPSRPGQKTKTFAWTKSERVGTEKTQSGNTTSIECQAYSGLLRLTGYHCSKYILRERERDRDRLMEIG